MYVTYNVAHQVGNSSMAPDSGIPMIFWFEGQRSPDSFSKIWPPWRRFVHLYSCILYLFKIIQLVYRLYQTALNFGTFFKNTWYSGSSGWISFLCMVVWIVSSQAICFSKRVFSNAVDMYLKVEGVEVKHRPIVKSQLSSSARLVEGLRSYREDTRTDRQTIFLRIDRIIQKWYLSVIFTFNFFLARAQDDSIFKRKDWKSSHATFTSQILDAYACMEDGWRSTSKRPTFLHDRLK